METLIPKLQYKNYERGEFSNSEMRTAGETIQLIKDYPWDEQRQLASVELTCPSVTIEHYTGKFLRSALILVESSACISVTVEKFPKK